MGTLYIVSTPIGNLQDISLRAMSTLFSVSVICCEDTRRTGLLLGHIAKNFPTFSQRPKLLSYFEHNELNRIPEILTILSEGLSVALISDAGTPAISDPGFKLIREAATHGVRIESIPGPTALIAALVVSGLPSDKFIFLGYPPRKTKHKKDLLEKIIAMHMAIEATVIFYEAPHRLLATLSDMKTLLGNIPVVLCSELTKLFEETKRGTLEEVMDYYGKKKPKGEFVILFHTKSLTEKDK